MKEQRRILSVTLCLALLLAVFSFPAGAAKAVYNELPIIPPHTHSYVYTDNGNGTHTVTCSVSGCAYSATESHTYTNGTCVCGATQSATEQLRIISAAPLIDKSIHLVYTVSVPSGYSNPYMTFTFNGASSTVTNYTTENGRLKYTFSGINPQCMGDAITATLYATKNGATESVSYSSYSVRQYCLNKLADDSISDNLRKLLSDLLAYGAAAQTYMGYETGALVTAGEINNPTYSTFTDLSGLGESFDGDADTNVFWMSAGLTLTDSVAMRFRFCANSVNGLIVYVTINGRTQTFTEFTAIGNGVYEVSFTGICADEFGDTVKAVFERDDEQIGNELSYSVNAYVQSKQNDGNANLKALVRALCNYGASAKAYAG